MKKEEKYYQIYRIHLLNGEVIEASEEYDLPVEKGLVGKFQKADDNKIFEIGDDVSGLYCLQQKAERRIAVNYLQTEVVTMIYRPLYVDKIMAYVDTPFVKILTGVRRCGKSTILKMIMERLKTQHNISEERIVSCRYDSMEYEDMTVEKAYLLHLCSRFDLQGKEILKTQEKFYLADTALRYSVLGYNSDSVASSLENVVYLELCRRGYTVNVGKFGNGESDFAALRQNEKIYVQVTQTINSEKTEKREYERLLEIHGNYPKYVLTTDEFSGGNYEGIKMMHIADFLLSSEY